MPDWIIRDSTHALRDHLTLQPGRTYQVQVRSIGRAYSEWGDPESVIALPDVPQRFDWFSRTEDSVTLAWEDITLADTYQIRKRLAGVTNWDFLINTFGRFAYKVENLNTDATYEFQVRSATGLYRSDWSSVLSVELGTTLNVVEDLASSHSAGIVRITWTAFEGVIDYEVEARRDTRDGAIVFSVTLEPTQYRFWADEDQTYVISVRAKITAALGAQLAVYTPWATTTLVT